FSQIFRSNLNNLFGFSKRNCLKTSQIAQTAASVSEIDENEHLNLAYYNEQCEASLKNPDYFEVKKFINLKEMFDSRVYLGHKEGTLNPYMKPYIFGSRLGHLILDLDQTVKLLQEALNFIAHISFRNGIILFINKSATTGHIVERLAMNCQEFSHCRDWVNGTFLDSTKFFQAVTRLPDLVIFLNTHSNIFETHPAIKESAKMMIPTVGIVDTNSDPRLITYPIPGNDDTIQSIEYFCKIFEKTILLAKQKRMDCLRMPFKEEIDTENLKK
ncbi:28S ribosomal protein S2, mitochondrial-like protein, partial [Sarcoptes scabiei]